MLIDKIFNEGNKEKKDPDFDLNIFNTETKDNNTI